MEQTEHGAPRMADEIDLLFGIRLAQIVDDGIEVFQVLRDSEPSGVGRPIERASRATLIEVGHKEVALQIAIEIAKQRPPGPPCSQSSNGALRLVPGFPRKA